jgi:hypothetical protein
VYLQEALPKYLDNKVKKGELPPAFSKAALVALGLALLEPVKPLKLPPVGR